MVITEEYYNTGMTEIERFIKTSKMKHLNKVLKIDKISSMSKLFFYTGLIGLILFIISIIFHSFWIAMWIYAIIIFIFLGFIFARPNSSYNFVLVLGIFTVLAFVPSFFGQGLLSIFSLDIVNETNYSDSFIEALSHLASNPLDNLELYATNFITILNWIFFIACGGFGVVAVADAWTLQFGDATKKAALIALAIAIYVFIMSILNLATSVQIPSIFDTVGTTITNILHNVGLAELDQSGIVVVNVRSISEGLYSWIPLILVIGMFIGAWYFRKSAFQSILFAKRVTEDNMISVERSRFSVSVLVLFLVMIVYVVGYFLVTAEPTITISPFITLIFYLSAFVILILIGMKVLIVNKSEKIRKVVYKTVKWTIFGLMGLFMWFQVFQPIVYQLGLTDTQTGLLTLSQGNTIFEADILEQIFLVAMPETLIFQVGFIGIGNRVYYYFRRTRISLLQEKKIEKEITKLKVQRDAIKINPFTTSHANLINLARLAILTQKINQLTDQVQSKKFSKVSLSFFIIPSLISGLIGSFLFSTYHSFRRGIDFIVWWQNPQLGMVYFGAGFFLCFIAFISYPASILTHGFNNIIAIMLAGMI